jgi:Domain of unknown function (DUF4760)
MVWALIVTSSGPDWAAKLTAFGTFAIAGGLIFTGIQIKETRRDRHIQVLSDFGRRWDEADLREARQLRTKYGSSKDVAALVEPWLNREEAGADLAQLLVIPNYFEDLALMVECGKLRPQLVAKAMRSVTLDEWDFWEPAITRIRVKDDSAYTEFEALAKLMREQK